MVHPRCFSPGSGSRPSSRTDSRCASPEKDTTFLVNEARLNNSLTSLSWLHNLQQGLGGAAPSCLPPTPEVEDTLSDMETTDWSIDSSEKPPFSYATLIYEAISNSDEGKLTLSDIYRYIETNYIYYQTVETGWKNSIRHNLSQNKCFMKLSRTEERPGKGGFWAVTPEHEHLLIESAAAKQRRRRRKLKAEQRRRARLQAQREQLQRERAEAAGEEEVDPVLQPPEGIDSTFFGLNSSSTMRDCRLLVPQLFGGPIGTAEPVETKEGIVSSPEPADTHPWTVPCRTSLMESERALKKQSQPISSLFNSGGASVLTCSLNGSLSGLGLSGGLSFPLAASFSEFLPGGVANGISFTGQPSRPQSCDDGDSQMMAIDEDDDEDDEMKGLKTPSDWL